MGFLKRNFSFLKRDFSFLKRNFIFCLFDFKLKIALGCEKTITLHPAYPQRNYLYMEKNKKYIAPGAWFTMLYPATWSEFEDGEGSFLFYNPDEWTGNFRISAYRGDNLSYGDDCVKQELKENPSARQVHVGNLVCAYSTEEFEEQGVSYTSHFWITGLGNTTFECSFTVRKGDSVAEAEQVIRSLQIRQANQKYPPELIPVRLSEIFQIDEAYEWVAHHVKEVLKKDFQGVEEDILSLQMLIDRGILKPKKRDGWLNIGIVLCVIVANEADGWEWRTLVDGNREAPVLQYVDTNRIIDPMKLTWSRIKRGEQIDLAAIYEAILNFSES